MGYRFTIQEAILGALEKLAPSPPNFQRVTEDEIRGTFRGYQRWDWEDEEGERGSKRGIARETRSWNEQLKELLLPWKSSVAGFSTRYLERDLWVLSVRLKRGHANRSAGEEPDMSGLGAQRAAAGGCATTGHAGQERLLRRGSPGSHRCRMAAMEWTVYLFSDTGQVLWQRNYKAPTERDAERLALKLVKPHLKRFDNAEDWVFEPAGAGKRASLFDDVKVALTED